MLLYESIWFNKFCFKRHGERHPLWGVQRYSFFTIGGLHKLLNFRKVTVYFRKLHYTLSTTRHMHRQDFVKIVDTLYCKLVLTINNYNLYH